MKFFNQLSVVENLPYNLVAVGFGSVNFNRKRKNIVEKVEAEIKNKGRK